MNFTMHHLDVLWKKEFLFIQSAMIQITTLPAPIFHVSWEKWKKENYNYEIYIPWIKDFQPILFLYYSQVCIESVDRQSSSFT